MGKLKTVLGLVVAAIVLVVGGVWVYINVIKEGAPEALTLEASSTTTTPDADDSSDDGPASTTPASNTTAEFDGSLDGTWIPGGETVAGYRVAETLAGQSTEGVGRTDQVTGAMSIVGTTITEADFSVDMASITSDSDRRDNQYQTRLMQTNRFPTSTFVLTEPIELGTEPAEGEEITVDAVGDLTLKDTTKAVTFELQAKRVGGVITVVATYEITFADWGIEDPSNGFAQVGSTGLLELRHELVKE